uniref:Antibacterial toxin n=1 Tax=Pogonoperca punctata TaxID=160738 RepID=A0ZT22_POGPU|nr:antibacterial toxin [Pogonoperca punctata]
MKLGLLVVLAVVVLVPSLSEGQNVPSCQLKAVEAGNMRNKREADESSEESDSAENERSLEEAGNRLERSLRLKRNWRKILGQIAKVGAGLLGSLLAGYESG